MDKTEDGGPAFPGGAVRKTRPAHDPGADFRVTDITEPKQSGMTLRQYAAIKLRVPNSGTDWLDEMIRTSLRDDLAWARFCGAFGDGPDAPYPGMIAAFETHYGQSFRDKEWRTEAACWAAAWSKATARADAKNDSYRLDALEAVAKASGTGVSFDWCRHVDDFYRIAGEKK